MPEVFQAFGAVFGVIGLAMVLGGLGLAAFLLYRLQRRSRALTTGVTAVAQCLEAYVTQERRTDEHGHHHTHSVRQVILGFRTQDGQDIRIRDTSGIPRVVGDFAEVRYLPDRPQDAAVVGRYGGAVALGVGVGLFFCLMLIGVGVAFTVFGWFFGFGTPDPGPDMVGPTGF